MGKNNTSRPPRGPQARGGQKAKDFKGSLAKLVKYNKKYMPVVIVAVILAIVSTVCSIIGPTQLAQMTDIITQGVMTGIDIDAVIKVAIILCVIYGVSAITGYFQGRIMTTVTQRVSQSLRTDISAKINKLPLNYFDKGQSGDVLSRVTNDADTIGQALNHSVSSMITCIALIIGSLIMMLITSPIMTLAAVSATIVGFIIMMVIMKKSQKYFTRQQRELGNINGHVEEIYTGHLAVKAYNGEKKASSVFDKINKSWRDSAWKAGFLSGLMMPIMTFVGNFGYVAVCVVGVALVFSGEITFGIIVAFMVYVRLFTNPLSQLAQAFTQLQTAAAASERVFEILDEEEMQDETGKTVKLDTDKVKGDVCFENVHFGYNPEKIIINDFSACAKAGQKIAIVGPTGAGKTTLVNLLMRFYETNSGDIRIDGVSIKDMTRQSVHDLFCMVLQDTWLFEGTVKENIAYSKQGVTDEEIEKACRAVGIHHFIKTLPKGYDTVLDDKANLSQGQKQLLTIARAMVENAPLLILDEATSSVDTRTEVIIQQAMDKLTQGRTSFVIAHRLSTIRNADLILVMKDGDIIESGSHDELMQKQGFYAELYNSQFDKEDE